MIKGLLLKLSIDQNHPHYLEYFSRNSLSSHKNIDLFYYQYLGFNQAPLIKLFQIMNHQFFTERVLIDPERLLKLKKQRKSLKFVPSIYEPPKNNNQDTDHTHHHHLSLQSQQQSISSQFRYEFIKKSQNANVEFIISLLGSIKNDQIVELQEGDCLNIKYEERSLILEGQIKITGINNNSYTMEEGYFFFVSSQNYKKVKQIVCLKQTKILRISNLIYQQHIKNYYFLKNAQKIKYLKYCPFFIWKDQLSEELASCMKMQIFQKEEIIYSTDAVSEKIYFVKEGIVLLQRNVVLKNKFFNQYQNHYQKNEINQTEVTLIVKKGMVFGIDGILLKQLESISPAPFLETIDEQNQQNPENIKYNSNKIKLNTRIYTAKTIGRTQVYSINRQVIETLFNLTDMLYNQEFPRILTKADLQKICSDYSEMVIRHKSLPKISQSIVRKNLVIDHSAPSADIEQKRAKAKNIRLHEQFAKKISIANIIADPKNIKNHNNRLQFTGSHDQNASLLNQLNYRLSMMEVPNENNHLFAFPLLTSSVKKRNKLQEIDHGQKYIFKWLKDNNDPYRPKKRYNESLEIIDEKRAEKIPKMQRQIESKEQKLNLIKIKSYRNIIQNLL